MKHKCAAKGCSQRGIWMYTENAGVYCAKHKGLIGLHAARIFKWPSNRDYVGQVHEGRKVGKPRSWKEATARDGWQPEALSTGQDLPLVPPAQDGL